MIKITQVVTSLEPSGPTKVIEEIVKKKYEDVEFQILVIGGKSIKQIGGLSDVKVIYTHSKYNVFKNLYCILNTEAHILHCHGFRPIFFVAIFKFFFFKSKKITICTNHSDVFSEFLLEYGLIKGKLLLEIYKYLLIKMDLLVCVSETIKKNLISNYKNFRIKVIQNGVKIKNKNKNKNNKTYDFISIGHLSNLKNTIFLIQVFEKLSDKYKLHIYGNDKSLYINEKHYKNIIFHGFKDKLDEIYNSSHCLVSASQSEGTPLSVLEAISSGCLIFLSNIPAHKEIIKNLNLSKKYLFGLNSYKSLTKKIKSFHEFYDEKYQLAINKACVFYNSEAMSQKYYLLYKELIDDTFNK